MSSGVGRRPPRYQGVAAVDFVSLGLRVGTAESAFSNRLDPGASSPLLLEPQFPYMSPSACPAPGTQ